MPLGRVSMVRFLMPVTATSPTFCEKLVWGKVLKMPPISMPRPSVISPSAKNMPVN